MNQDGTEIKNDKKQSSHCFVRVFVSEKSQSIFSASLDFTILIIDMKHNIRNVLKVIFLLEPLNKTFSMMIVYTISNINRMAFSKYKKIIVLRKNIVNRMMIECSLSLAMYLGTC